MGWWGGRGAPLCRLAVTRCHDVTNPSRDDTSHRHTQHSQLMTPGEKNIIRAVPSSLRPSLLMLAASLQGLWSIMSKTITNLEQAGLL